MPNRELELPPYDFDALNETDIREEIIAPLLRNLGYRSGTENNIIREQPLNYPKSFLGRKKGTDPVLRGRADYICDVQEQVRWVIEAKSPDATLDREVEEQSWSYASHPEIRAVYFCLTNGKAFKISKRTEGRKQMPSFSVGTKISKNLWILFITFCHQRRFSVIIRGRR